MSNADQPMLVIVTLSQVIVAPTSAEPQFSVPGGSSAMARRFFVAAPIV